MDCVRNRRRWRIAVACGCMSVWASIAVRAADTMPTTQPIAEATQPAAGEAPSPTRLAPVIVTANRVPQPLQDVPASITALDAQTLRDGRIQNINDAAPYSPNVYISQFTNSPRNNFPYIRGIGSGENSPAITTYIDGVPQISFSTANQEFVDVDHVEFLRGPQGTLYGRNTLGGVINIDGIQPTNVWHADGDFTGGTYDLQDYRGGIRGPVVDNKVFIAVAGGYVNRDGYTGNYFTHSDLDDRNDNFGRAEIRFTPTDRLDIRLTYNFEKDRDGDYPLADLASVRAQPFIVNHNFQGETARDVKQGALNAIYHGDLADITSVSAVQYWHSNETDDLDDSPADLLRRANTERQTNYIEELRLFDPLEKPIVINSAAKVHFVAGTLFFATNDSQTIDNITLSPELTAPLPAPLSSFTTQNLNTYGIGAYGQGTLTLWDKLDVTGGARVDFEYNHAILDSFASSPFVPRSTVDASRNDVFVSPKFSADYHLTKDLMPYVTIDRGYKAGGFNSTAPSPDKASFAPERSWSYEGGFKSGWFDNRLTVNADFYYIEWHNMQLDVPTGEPSVFFIDNAGHSHSYGGEVEANLQVTPAWNVFAGGGTTHARFDQYIQTNGVSAAGLRLPNAPDYTFNAGAQYTMKLPHDLQLFARVEEFGTGPFDYDASNAAEQGFYSITNFRVGFGGANWRLEGWVNNAFNTHYVPIAFPFPLARSGYVGQSGAPVTAGVTLGLTF